MEEIVLERNKIIKWSIGGKDEGGNKIIEWGRIGKGKKDKEIEVIEWCDEMIGKVDKIMIEVEKGESFKRGGIGKGMRIGEGKEEDKLEKGNFGKEEEIMVLSEEK